MKLMKRLFIVGLLIIAGSFYVGYEYQTGIVVFTGLIGFAISMSAVSGMMDARNTRRFKKRKYAVR